jgi:hypothetical protein
LVLKQGWILWFNGGNVMPDIAILDIVTKEIAFSDENFIRLLAIPGIVN